MQAYRKTVRIHNTLPEGGILVFVTGQQEVNYLVNKLRRAFPKNSKEKRTTESPNEDDSGDDFDSKKMPRKSKKAKQNLPEINLDDYSLQEDTDVFSGEEYDGLSEDEEQVDDEIVYRNAQPLWALPLYSMLPSQRQQMVTLWKLVFFGIKACCCRSSNRPPVVADSALLAPMWPKLL